MNILKIFFIILFSSNIFAQTLEDLVSIRVEPHSLPALNKEWNAKDLEDYFNQTFVNDIPNHEKVFQVEKVGSLPHGAKVSIKPVLVGEKTYVRIAMTADAFSDPVAMVLTARYVKSINGSMFASTHSWIEAVTNARMQSKTALWSLAEAKINLIEDIDRSYSYFDIDILGENYNTDLFNKYLNETLVPTTKSQYKEIETQAKLALKQQKEKYEARKVIFDELDKSPKQLKDLIAKNDRQGVAKLIETYLPWEHMEPVEVKYWKDWLEAVKNPLPLEQRTLVLRGLDNGQAFFNDAKQAFLMPPVIINNQGTYNRRLRSLTTMLDKNISLNPNHEYTLNPRELKKISRSSRITNQLLNHSKDPMGSPHISFTKSAFIANQFSGNGKIGIFSIDPRLITPNLMSGYKEEIELIASMVVFPDENLGIIDNLDNIDNDQRLSYIDDELKSVLEKKFGSDKAKTIYEKEFGYHNKLSTLETFQIESRKTFFDRLDGISASNCSVHLSP